ncbi:hypothetical protein MIND_01374500 [Mycena indigotica]|uniref:Uncharacterized protein n=1 Tax=Mycena indigotica TaxID=2126181 RepID=A0A8H6S0N8_9AGAR|nr:uncharacterized protein MIND_01374500 [Mycena indigotica]KAF7289135.1 hypothetical protein MIND_01374500 [Mycena indigotica]
MRSRFVAVCPPSDSVVLPTVTNDRFPPECAFVGSNHVRTRTLARARAQGWDQPNAYYCVLLRQRRRGFLPLHLAPHKPFLLGNMPSSFEWEAFGRLSRERREHVTEETTYSHIKRAAGADIIHLNLNVTGMSVFVLSSLEDNIDLLEKRSTTPIGSRHRLIHSHSSSTERNSRVMPGSCAIFSAIQVNPWSTSARWQKLSWY